ncbi:NUDIX hydrolase [Gilvimarinus sp. F26214L]|uniref:NUDIX hydrolase n=1 Tax=Gilvimarinus sp. DZF01 TaxID=3461371 RepID=UPI004045DC17
MRWCPHVTVAAVVERQNRFLMVRERSETGQLVYNQPAGHLEEGESLLQAVVRETLEETRWQVSPSAVLSIRMFTSPANQVTYLRTSFVAEPLAHYPEYNIDQGIEEAVWMSEEEIVQKQHELRSELVLQSIRDYRAGKRFPLELLGS